MSNVDTRRQVQSKGAARLNRRAELFTLGRVLGLGFRGGWSAALGGAIVASVCSAALAGPEGASVARGNVNISHNGSETLIHASNNSIINYRSFDIGAGETVRFIQPSATSRVLNRITSARPTQIDGNLTANGRVYIVNPAGVFFGQGSVINAAGLYASAGHLSDNDFVRGIDHFTDVQGDVRNYGTLTADFIALVGARVDNQASIYAPQGTVVMTSGSDVLIGEKNGNVFVKLEGQSAQAAANAASNPKGVTNGGTVNAAGGKVLVAAGDMYSLALLGGSHVKATNVQVENQGRGDVIVQGQIDATNAAGKGGTVKVLGEHVGVVNANIDASGRDGGGTILLGGNYQGKGPERNATATFVGNDVTLKADAVQRGDGGKVVVWSDDITRFYGDISAQGGVQGGNGGFAEVSGKHNLAFDGVANTLAPQGRTGTLLLDPDTIVVQNSMGNTTTLPVNFATTPTAITIRDTVINNATSNVVLQANVSITVNSNAAISITTSGVGITMQSGGDIILNGGITTNNGFISLTANDAASGMASGTGAITIASGATLNAGTGAITLNAVSTSIGASITGGSLSVTGTATLGANVTTSGAGGAVFNGATTVSGTRTVNSSGGNGPITFNAAILGTTNNTDNLTLTAGTGVVTSAGGIGTNMLGLAAVNVSSSGSTSLSGSGIFASSLSVTGATTLATDVTTSGASGVTFNSALTVSGSHTIDTSAGNASFTFGSTINGTTAGVDQLFFTLGNTANLNISGAVGGSTRLGQFQINSANNITLAAVSSDFISVNSTSMAGTVQLNGLLTGRLSAADAVVVTGDTINEAGGIMTIQATGDSSVRLAAGTLLNITGNITTNGFFLNNGTGDVSLGASINTSGGGSGNQNLVFNAGSYLVTVTASNVTLNSGAGTLSIDNASAGVALDIGANNVTFQSNAVTMANGNLAGTGAGSLSLQGALSSTSIGVAGASGTAQFTQALITKIGTGTVSVLNIGASGGTETLTLGASTFDVPTNFRASGAGGLITIAGNVTGTNAGGLTFTGPVSVSGSRTVDTSGANAPISFTSTINGTTSNTDTLILTAGSMGTSNIVVSGIVGGTTPLSSFQVTTANNITLAAASAAAISLTSSSAAGTLQLNGLLTATQAATQSVVLVGNTINVVGGITTTQALGTSDILVTAGTQLTISGAINANGSFENSGTGAVTISGNIDTSNGSATHRDITFDAGAYLVTTSSAVTINYGTGTLTLANASGGHALNTNGQTITLQGNAISLPNGDFSGNGSGSITFVGATDATSIGVAGGSGTLQISQSLLNLVPAGTVASINIGAATGTEAIDIAASTLLVPTAFRAGGTGGTINIGGDIAANAGASVSFSADTAAASSTFPITLAANVTTTNQSISFSGNVRSMGTATVNAGTNTILVNNRLNLAGTALTLRSNTLLLLGGAGSVTGAGSSTLTLVGATDATSIGVGGSGASGTYTVSSTALAALSSGSVSILNIGAAAGTEAITIGTSSIAVPTAFRAGGVGGTITLANALTGTSTAAFTFTADTAAASNVFPISLGAGITTNNQAITFNGNVRATATATINSGTAAQTYNNELNINGQALTLRQNTLSFAGGAGSVIGNGSGTLTILGATNATSIGVGTGGGTLSFNATDLAALSNGAAAQIVFGSASQAADITFAGATFHDALVATTDSNHTIFITGNITGDQSDASVSLTAAAFNLGANIRTQGAGITITGNNASFGLTLSANAVLDTTNSGAAAGGAAINVGPTVNALAAGTQGLTLNAGNSAASDITFTNAVGGTTRLGALSITSGDVVSFQAVTAASVEQVAAASGGTAITTFAGAVNTNGLITATTNGVALTGRSFTLNGVTTTGTGGVAIDVTGGVLTLQTTALNLDGAFAKTGTGTTSLGVNISTTNDNIDFSGGSTTVTVDARTLAAGTGTITLNNALNLQTFGLTLSGNGIDLLGGANSVTGTTSASHLCLFGADGTVPIGVGTAMGTLDLSTTDIAAVASSVGSLQIGAASGTGVITVNDASTITFNQTAQFRAPTNVFIDVTAAGTGCLIFDGATLVGSAMTTTNLSASCIMFNGAATIDGNVAMTATNTATSGNTGITFASTVATNQAMGENLALSGNLLSFAGGASSVTGSGSGGLVLTPVTNATSIGVAGGTGTLQLTQAFFNAITPGAFSLVTVGASAGTHAISIAGGSYSTPVAFRAPGTGGTIAISSAITGTGAASFQFTADTAASSSTFPITLGAAITTANQNITFTGNTSFTPASATLSAGTGTIAFNNLLTINANALTLSANGIDFLGGAGSVTGTSAASRLCLFGATGATTIGVVNGSGALNLSLADIAAVDGTIGELQLGAPSGTGLITLVGPPSPLVFATTLDLRAPASVLTPLSLPSGACLIFDGSAIVGSSMTTTTLTAGCVIFNGAATLDGDVAITATNPATSGNTGITFASTVTTNQGSGENLALSGNLLAFNGGAGSVTGTGAGELRLTPVTSATSIGINGGSGTLQLTQTFFNAIDSAAFNLVSVGASAGTHAITIDAGTFALPLLFQTPGTGGTIDIAGNLTGTGPGAFRFVADTAASSSTFPITLGGSITTSNQSISFNGNTALGTGPFTLNAGTDTVRFENLLELGGQDLTIRTNLLTLAGGNNSVTGNGSGTLTLLGATDATSIGVGGAGGTAQISAADLDALADEATGQIVIGSATQAADINFGASTFRDALLARTDVNHSLVVGGTITGAASDASITLRGGVAFLGANIVTDGAAISFQGPNASGDARVRLVANATLDSTNSGAASTGANVVVNGTINDTTAAGTQGLSINAGSAGLVQLLGNVGSSIALGDLDVTGGGGIELGGNITTHNGLVTLHNNTLLLTDVAVDTTDAASVVGQNIAFGGTIDTQTMLSPVALSLNSGSASTVTVSGDIGSNNQLSTFTATGDQLLASIMVQNVSTVGAQTYNGWLSTGQTLTVSSSGAGIAVNGNLQLEDNGSDHIVRLVTSGSAAGDSIAISGRVNSDPSASNTPSMVLNAGTSGAVSIGSAVGDVSQIETVTINGGTIAVNNVSTVAGQAYTGALTLEAPGMGPTQLTNTAGSFDITVTGPLTLAHDAIITARNLIQVSGATDSMTGQNFSLTLDAPTINLVGQVGATQALNVFTTQSSSTAAGTLTLGNNAVNSLYNLHTAGAQSIAHATVLQQDTQLTADAGSAVGLHAIDSDANAARALTISTTGATTVTGAVGGTRALSTLTTVVGGSTTLTGNVTTTQAQVYGDNIILGGNMILFSAGNSASFAGTLDSDGTPRNLTITASGSVGFGGTVGGTSKLASLSVTAANISASDIRTTGAQAFTGTSLFLGSSTTDAGDISVTGATTLGDNASLFATGGSVLIFGNTTTGANSTLRSSGGSVALTGTLDLNGDTTLQTDGTTGSEDVNVGGTINSLSGNHALTATAGANGDVIFGGDIGLGTNTGQAALSSLVASGANITAASVRTVGSQSYGGGASSVTTLSGDIQTTGAGQVVFSGALLLSKIGTSSISTNNGSVQFGRVDAASSTNPSGLNVSAGGSGSEAIFTDLVGGTQALSLLTVSQGSARLAGGSVITTGAQTYGSVTLASTAGNSTSLFASGYTFNGAITGAGQTLNTDYSSANGITAFNSTVNIARLVVGGNSTSRNFDDTGTTRIGANMTFSNGADFRGTNVLTNNVTIQGGMGALLFRGTIDADSSANNRTLTLLSQRTASADFIPFGFGRSIGSTAALGAFNLGSDRAANQAQPSASAVFSDGFDDSGRVTLSSFANTDSFSVNVGSGGFSMGRGEKITSFGTITINSTGRVRLGDITSLVSIVVRSDNIDLLYRGNSPLISRQYLAGGSTGTPPSDLGLDFVAKNAISFLRNNGMAGPVVRVVDIGNTGKTSTDFVNFATDAGRPAVGVLGSESITPFRFFKLADSADIGPAGLGTGQFTDPRSGNGSFLLGFDLPAQGSSNAGLASSIAGAIPRDTETKQVATPVTVGKALREQLQDLGLNTRELSFEESVEFLVGRAVYRDIDLSRRVSDTGSIITVNRLAGPPVQEVVDAYLDLIKTPQIDPQTGQPVLDDSGKPVLVSREDTIKYDLGTSWSKYAETTDNPDGLGFRQWLEGLGSKAEQVDKDSLEFLNKARVVVEKLDTLGLSSYEVRTPTLNVLGRIQPPEISKIEDMEYAVLGKVVSLK